MQKDVVKTCELHISKTSPRKSQLFLTISKGTILKSFNSTISRYPWDFSSDIQTSNNVQKIRGRS